ADEQALIDDIIFDELIAGVVRPSSRRAFAAACERLHDRGADAVVLACTELQMLVPEQNPRVIDSTWTHAVAAWQIGVGVRDLPHS
ncbi:MAG TPA: aspartate/glutamate racemase family protein, partial [Thermoanaerobaculia bacterium]|nr:aspartate/glutamate racemase family protein [Thermoanaerobaculia bacterium]